MVLDVYEMCVIDDYLLANLMKSEIFNGGYMCKCPGDQMGLPRPPAFLDPSLDENLIFQSGVNFASGGGGILNETSSLFVSDHYLDNI